MTSSYKNTRDKESYTCSKKIILPTLKLRTTLSVDVIYLKLNKILTNNFYIIVKIRHENSPLNKIKFQILNPVLKKIILQHNM